MCADRIARTRSVQEHSLTQTHALVWSALLAALIAVGGYLHFPLGPVPISLQVLFVIMAGFILGPKRGLLAVGLYLVAGLVGLPVFHGGHGGLGHILGPTGGYLVGFVPAVLITGWGSKRVQTGPLPWIYGILIALLAYASIYVLGLSWLQRVLDVGWAQAATVGMLPFLLSDCLQIAICVSAVRYLQRHSLVLE
ncbi:MAG: biotin transporter BioY [Desulfovermiculus sp.]